MVHTYFIRGYLCPERRLSFDGFVSYEGIRFGVPSDYLLPTVRITRDQNSIRIFSYDFSRQLVSYPVTWSRQDQICAGQFEEIPQPEEFPTARVKTTIQQLPPTPTQLSFEKFNFDDEELQDESDFSVQRQGCRIHLTTTEYQLFITLLDHSGCICSRNFLLASAWNITVPIQTRTVDVHIAKLRKKLNLGPDDLKTVTRQGYALSTQESYRANHSA